MTAMVDTDPDSATASQAEINAEMAAIESDYVRAGVEETQPRLDYSPYRSSLLRRWFVSDRKGVYAFLRTLATRRRRVLTGWACSSYESPSKNASSSSSSVGRERFLAGLGRTIDFICEGISSIISILRSTTASSSSPT